MKRVIAFSVCFIGVVFFVKALPFLLLFIPPSVGERLETWESTNTPFKIRIDRHAQANGNYFVPGAYYVFQSAASGSDQWQEITTFRFDDPIDIPRNQVRFANEKVAYVFMIDMYAVTQDGGASWKISDIDNYLSKDEKCGSIEDLRIDANGVGEVKLKCYAKQDSFKMLETTDFGRRWLEK
ncbi:MAG: hypothetical protein M3367_10505 [Acidobacteriota bacterium]|nr:hypothetical protein [Acidobacteriota bacterium]